MSDYAKLPQHVYIPEGTKPSSNTSEGSGTSQTSGTSSITSTPASGTPATSGTTPGETNAPNQALYENQNATQAVAYGEFDSSVIFDTQSAHSPNMAFVSIGDQPKDPANNLVYQAAQQYVDRSNEGNANIMENSHKLSQTEAQAEIKLKMAEMDYKMTKELLDGLQKSLDRSSEMLKKNMEEFIKKVKPQMDAMQKHIQQAKSLEEAGNKEAAAKHLQQVSGIRQEIQSQVASLPKTGNPDVDAAVSALISALNTMQQASSR